MLCTQALQLLLAQPFVPLQWFPDCVPYTFELMLDRGKSFTTIEIEQIYSACKKDMKFGGPRSGCYGLNSGPFKIHMIFFNLSAQFDVTQSHVAPLADDR